MIVPPEDVLLDELTDIKGGAGFSLCIKGCCSGDSEDKDKDKDKSTVENNGK